MIGMSLVCFCNVPRQGPRMPWYSASAPPRELETMAAVRVADESKSGTDVNKRI